ncbi:ATP synthase subunit b [bacterium BMS3Bbin04]|nr:ATP synthase subunit b [bacterium BMS3Bbin04]
MRTRLSLVAPALLLGAVSVQASEAEGLGSLMSLAPGSMLYTLITFALLLLILWKFAWGPIVKGLESREESIHGAIEAAQKDRDEAAKMLAEYEQKLRATSTEISDRLNRAEKDAQQTIESAKQQARDEAEKLREQAKQEIEASKDKVAAELRSEMAKLACEVAAAAIGESFERDDHLRIIQRRLEQVESGS